MSTQWIVRFYSSIGRFREKMFDRQTDAEDFAKSLVGRYQTISIWQANLVQFWA